MPLEAAAAAAAAAAPLRKKLAYGLYADMVGLEKILEKEDGPPPPLLNRDDGFDTDGWPLPGPKLLAFAIACNKAGLKLEPSWV